jgi:hypothetical protein
VENSSEETTAAITRGNRTVLSGMRRTVAPPCT